MPQVAPGGMRAKALTHNDGYTVIWQVEFLTFSEGDPSGWIYQVETFFEV